MLGWTVISLFFFLALFFSASIYWLKTRKNTKVKKFSTNVKWLFGIFIFLDALDVWMTYFCILWLGICYEANPIFGEDLTLFMAITGKVAQILLVFSALKFISIYSNERTFTKYSSIGLLIVNMLLLIAIIKMQVTFHQMVYHAAQSGFFM